MGTYLSSPLSAKEVASGSCESMGLRWGVCSMQGWRVSMEDAHLVLYARKQPAAPAATAIGCTPTASANKGADPQQHQSASPADPLRRISISNGQELLSHLFQEVGATFQRPADSYVFVPAEDGGFPEEAGFAQKVGGSTPTPLSAAAAAASSAAPGEDDTADLLEGGSGELDATNATPTNRKGLKVRKAVLRQFSRRRKGSNITAQSEGEGVDSCTSASPLASPAGRQPPGSRRRAASVKGPVTRVAEGTGQGIALQQADLCVFAVFDGHGGAHVARYVQGIEDNVAGVAAA